MKPSGMVIEVSHASDEAISAAIDASADPVVAPIMDYAPSTTFPANMPDALLKKLAAKGGVIGFQIGNEFHNRQAFDWVTGARRQSVLGHQRHLTARPLRFRFTNSTKSSAAVFPCWPADIPENIE